MQPNQTVQRSKMSNSKISSSPPCTSSKMSIAKQHFIRENALDKKMIKSREVITPCDGYMPIQIYSNKVEYPIIVIHQMPITPPEKITIA